MLALILAILVGGLWAVRRFAPGAGRLAGYGSGIKVLAQHPLGPKRTLLLVKVGDRVLLLGSSEHSINLISPIDDPEFLAGLEERPAGGGFARMLARTGLKTGQGGQP